MTAPLSSPGSPLIDAATLAARLAGPDAPLLWDCSFDLADPSAGERAHAAARLPGAVHAHLDRDLSGPKSSPVDAAGRHPLPTPAAFAAAAARLGVSAGRAVVVYDRQGGMFAARAWWLLQWIGHAPVQVLDGGLPAWQAAGFPVESGPAAQVPAGTLAAPAHTARVTVDADALTAALGRVPLLDARAPERWRGDVEPLDPVAGHIPGSRNRPFATNLQPDGRFKPAAVLRAEFEALGLTPGNAGEVVNQCGSGVTACHNLLAMEVAGLPGARLYPGSWSGWCADPARPVARG